MNELRQKAEVIAATAACCVSAGTPASRNGALVTKALRLGRQLAMLNRAVPLPVLLDAAAQTSGDYHYGGFLRAGGQVANYDTQYSDWIRALHRNSRGLLERHDFLNRVGDHDDLSGFIPLLAQAWPPAKSGEALHYDGAYALLLNEPLLVREAWASRRSADPELWDWWPETSPKIAPLQLALFHALYFPRASQRLGQFLHHFDHAAGHFYLDSPDAILLGDQAQRIRSLHQPRPVTQSWPLTESFDYLDPRFGAMSLSALVGDTIEQVWYNLRSHPRINNPPPFRPPQTVQVHVGWMVGARAAAEATAIDPKWFKRSKDSPNAKAEHPNREKLFSHSALLLGLVALVVDDWRYFLRPLPVDFFLHREFPRIEGATPPDPNWTLAGTTGNRWKDLGEGNADCLPPAETVTLLFDAITRDTVLLAPDADKFPAPLPLASRLDSHTATNAAWWCLFVCREDLENLGFKRIDRPQGACYRREEEADYWLPGSSPYSHVVILDPDEQQRSESQPRDATQEPDGSLCCVAACPGVVEFLSLPRRPARAAFPFSTLRIHLVDILIEQLQRLV